MSTKTRLLDWITARWHLPGVAAAMLLACTPGHAQTAAGERTEGSRPSLIEAGAASYYGRAHQGKRTASGSTFEQSGLTAAHPWLPFGSRIRVTLEETGRSVIVTVTDRLYSRRRIIDLSLGAARSLGMLRQGVAMVALTPA